MLNFAQIFNINILNKSISIICVSLNSSHQFDKSLQFSYINFNQNLFKFKQTTKSADSPKRTGTSYYIKYLYIPDIQTGMESSRIVLLRELGQRTLKQCQSYGQQQAKRQDYFGSPPGELGCAVVPSHLDDSPAKANSENKLDGISEIKVNGKKSAPLACFLLGFGFFVLLGDLIVFWNFK